MPSWREKMFGLGGVDREVNSNEEGEGEGPRIRISYEVVTPESAEQGDVAERGWEDEDGVSMVPDDDDEESAVDRAVEFLQENGATEPSSTAFHPGLWYRTPDADTDYRTGESTYRSFHLVEFTEDEQREIFDEIYGNQHGSSARSRANRKWTRRS